MSNKVFYRTIMGFNEKSNKVTQYVTVICFHVFHIIYISFVKFWMHTYLVVLFMLRKCNGTMICCSASAHWADDEKVALYSIIYCLHAVKLHGCNFYLLISWLQLVLIVMLKMSLLHVSVSSVVGGRWFYQGRSSMMVTYIHPCSSSMNHVPTHSH